MGRNPSMDRSTVTGLWRESRRRRTRGRSVKDMPGWELETTSSERSSQTGDEPTQSRIGGIETSWCGKKGRAVLVAAKSRPRGILHTGSRDSAFSHDGPRKPERLTVAARGRRPQQRKAFETSRGMKESKRADHTTKRGKSRHGRQGSNVVVPFGSGSLRELGGSLWGFGLGERKIWDKCSYK